MATWRRWLVYPFKPNRLALHIVVWVCVLAFYVANYQRLVDAPLWVPFVVKDVLIVAALFYSLPFIMDRWMAYGITLGGVSSLLLFGLAGYSLWAGAGALVCQYILAHYPATSGSVVYLANLLLEGGFLQVFTPAKFSVLALDFTFLVSAPLVGRLVSEVKKRNRAKQKLESELLRSENRRLNAELKQLKAQLPPHFVYNTLNNIHAMVEPASRRGAEAIHQFAQLTRYTSYQSAEDLVPLQQELDTVNNYWQLSAIRFSAAVTLQKDMSASEADGLLIPPMLLLIFVENAFKHGPGRNPLGAWVQLAVTFDDGELTMDLSNSVDQNARQPPSGRLGLHHAEQLLESHFHQRYHYTVQAAANQYRMRLIIKSY